MSDGVYRFGNFTLRPAGSEDLALAERWTAADPEHSNTTLAKFWIAQRPETNSFLLLNGGAPIFFFRIDERPEKQIEVHIQFHGPEALRQRLTRRGVIEGFAWLEEMLSGCGFEGYYFHSRNSPLIFFCQNRLGFEWDGTKLYRDLRRKERGEAEREEAQCTARR